jgi:hypothetical protein
VSKKSKHPHYDDPTAFSQRWPRIEPIDRHTGVSTLQGLNEQMYKMGKVRATVTVPSADGYPGYFMTVRCNDRYPTWDEIVWLRYNLIPDAAIMSLVLPNLNAYINQEDTGHKFVFTMEQKGWALDPPPQHCDREMKNVDTLITTAIFHCDTCGYEFQVDFTTWNEQHGNGFNGKVKA